MTDATSETMEYAVPPDDSRDEDRRRRAFGCLLTAIAAAIIIWWILTHIAMVPGTIGMSQRRAQGLIGEAGFETSVTAIPAGDAQAGRVITQTPINRLYFTFWPIYLTVGGGEELADGGGGLTIDRSPSGLDTVAIGSSDYEVYPYDPDEEYPLYNPPAYWDPLMPNVQNLTKADATKRVKDAGLKVKYEYGPSTTDVAKGRIYYQSPAPGWGIDGVGTATLWVSEGPLNVLTGPYSGQYYPRPPSGVE